MINTHHNKKPNSKKMIGKGVFTKAYLLDKNTVLLKSKCPTKECMSLGWFPDSQLFPKIKRLSYADNKGYQLFQMKYYPPIKSPKRQLNKKHYEYYKELRRIYTRCNWGMKDLEIPFQHIKSRHLKKIMLEAVDALRNYGDDVSFEISPRNIRATKSGRLILLDVFYFRSRLPY